jgi:hypothetical protein
MYWVTGNSGVALCAVGNLQAAGNSTYSTVHAPAVMCFVSVCAKCVHMCVLSCSGSRLQHVMDVWWLLDLRSAVPAVVRHRFLLACGVLVV